jgi:hypothetical protein
MNPETAARTAVVFIRVINERPRPWIDWGSYHGSTCDYNKEEHADNLRMLPKIQPIRDIVTFPTARTFVKPLFAVLCNRLRAGLSSPSDDYFEGKTDLNVYLGEHPAATFPCDHHSFIPLF